MIIVADTIIVIGGIGVHSHHQTDAGDLNMHRHHNGEVVAVEAAAAALAVVALVCSIHIQRESYSYHIQ